MSKIWAKEWKCDVCGWRWPDDGSDPRERCANSKCRSIRWNTGKDETVEVRQESATKQSGTTRSYDTDEYTETPHLTVDEKRASAEYRKRTGKTPASVSELIKAGFLHKGIPT